MKKRKEKVNSSRIICGLIGVAISILLLVVFVVITKTENGTSSEDSLYSIAIFSFVLGVLIGITSLEFIFLEYKSKKINKDKDSNKK